MVIILHTPDLHQYEAAPWDKETARVIRRRAEGLFTDHRHDANADKLTRDHCGACALSAGGWVGRRFKTPNYAGWERVFVQAGKPVPPVYLVRAVAQPVYGPSLLRDLATFTILEPSATWKALAAQNG